MWWSISRAQPGSPGGRPTTSEIPLRVVEAFHRKGAYGLSCCSVLGVDTCCKHANVLHRTPRTVMRAIDGEGEDAHVT